MTKSSSPGARLPPFGVVSFLISSWAGAQVSAFPLSIHRTSSHIFSGFLSGLLGRGAGTTSLPKAGPGALNCVCPPPPARNAFTSCIPFWAGLQSSEWPWALPGWAPRSQPQEAPQPTRATEPCRPHPHSIRWCDPDPVTFQPRLRV